jgi:hypothetical protein
MSAIVMYQAMISVHSIAIILPGDCNILFCAFFEVSFVSAQRPKMHSMDVREHHCAAHFHIGKWNVS